MYFLHHFVMTTIVVFIISHTAHSENTADIEKCIESLKKIGYTGEFVNDKNLKITDFKKMAGLYVPGYRIIMSHFVITKNGEKETITKEDANLPDIDWSNEKGVKGYCNEFHKKEYSSEKCHGRIYNDYKLVNELSDTFLNTNDYGFSYRSVLSYIRAMFNVKGEGEDQDKIIKQTHENLKKLDIINFVCNEKVEYRAEADEGKFPDEIEI